MILLPLAVLMCAYALMVYVWRAQAIAKKQVCSPACISASADTKGLMVGPVRLLVHEIRKPCGESLLGRLLW